jgi:hypothetical protein
LGNIPKELGHSDEEVQAALLADDDLVAVLRGHLYIEAELNDLLRAFVPGCDEMLNELDFMQKAKVARRMRLFGKPTMRSLQAIAEIRNEFAHELRRDLTAADDARMYDAVHPHNKLFIDDYFQRWSPSEKGVPGILARLAIARVHADMVHLSGLAPFEPGEYDDC